MATDVTKVPGRGVVILGMHRSGTSALAECLVTCGLSPGAPDALIPPAPDNPRGFFELRDVVAADDRVLAAVGSRWDVVAHDPSAFDDGFTPVRQELASLLTTSLPADRWLLKDPRHCVLWPLYRPLFETPPVVVVIARSPAAVAASLERRDLVDHELAVETWARYNAAALAAADDVPHAVVLRYEDLLTDPVAQVVRVADVAARAGLPLEPDPDRLRAVVDPSLRTNVEIEPADGSPAGRIWAVIGARAAGEDAAPPAGDVGPRTARVAAAVASVRGPDDIARAHTAADGVAGPGHGLGEGWRVRTDSVAHWLDRVDAGEPVAVSRWSGPILRSLGTALRAQEGWRSTVAIAADRTMPSRDRAAARDRIVDALPSLGRGPLGPALDLAQEIPGLWTSGYGAEAARLLAEEPAAGVDTAVTVRTDASLDASGPDAWWMALALRTFRGEDPPVHDATQWERAALDGSIERLLDVVRSRTTLIVGALHLADLADAWQAPGLLHVPLPGSEAVAQRRDFLIGLADVVRSIAAEQGRPPLVLAAIEPLGPAVVDAVRRAEPTVPVLDLGAVPEVWLEPWRRGHRWADGFTPDRT